MTLKERVLTARLLDSLKKHPEYKKQLQIEVIASSNDRKRPMKKNTTV